jgi:micrococcal nuclease
MQDFEQHRFWYAATIRRVVDADTIDLDIDLGFSIHSKQRVRLARVDAWEVRGEEREQGQVAKARVEELLPLGKVVYVQTHKDKTGKYGRYIAEIWLSAASPVNLSDLLVEEGHAEYVKY